MIPEHVVSRAVQDMIDGLHEICGIRRHGAERSLGGVDEWLSWYDHDRAVARWADDGGREP